MEDKRKLLLSLLLLLLSTVGLICLLAIVRSPAELCANAEPLNVTAAAAASCYDLSRQLVDPPIREFCQNGSRRAIGHHIRVSDDGDRFGMILWFKPASYPYPLPSVGCFTRATNGIAAKLHSFCIRPDRIPIARRITVERAAQRMSVHLVLA